MKVKVERKIDFGSIMLGVSQDDLEALKPLTESQGYPIPDTKISIYKNRRGRYKDILLWCVSDKGTCKIEPKFVTDYTYILLDLPMLRINVSPREDGAF